VRPFLLACSTRNAKFAGSGIVGLQRLVVSNALPKETLTEVLEAFRECSTSALDIQLKVLQALPSLLQNYASSLTGKLLITAFQVCFLLYTSKTAVISNTAAAALQQLVNSTLEKAAVDEYGPLKDEPVVEVPISDGTVAIYGAALDAHRLLEDICLLTDGQRPRFLPAAALAPNFGLELLESVLSNNADTVMAHPEQIYVLRTRLVPLIIRILSERASFSTTVRTMRLLQLIVRRLLFALAPECEIALSLLNHMLDPDAAAVWKRALCLEVFRSIHSEPALMRSIYAYYDEADEKRNIVRDHLGGLVRLASERPAIIGLGQQSSMPTSLGQNDDPGEQAAIQAGGLVGSIGAPSGVMDSNRLGISSQWSTVRIPCIDLLDKSEPPALPATYMYGLALDCVTTFSEGLARFLLPFTVPGDGRSRRKQTENHPTETDQADGQPGTKLLRSQSYGGRRTPMNPLTLKDHALYSQISTSGHMVEHCWPALLAASSTYLNATLDSENYHALIRSFQKFTQVAGLLDLATPRDAFLTTLGKHAVPALKSTAIAPQDHGRGSSDDLTDSDLDSSPRPSTHRRSTELPMPTMSTRHLLCLRALLNLGIALGPVLGKSWTIILETLLQADLILSVSGQTQRRQPKSSDSKAESEAAAEKAEGVEDLGLEITAAETAASRLFETTSDLPSDAFLNFLTCLCSLLHVEAYPKAVPDGLLSPQPAARKHQKVHSVSGFAMEGGALGQSNGFVIDKLDDVVRSNVVRLLGSATSASGWDILVEVLNRTISTHSARSDVRLKAANALNDMLVAVAISEEPTPPEERDAIRGRSLNALQDEIMSLRKATSQDTRPTQSCESEIHRLALEALKSILEDCGESLELGWSSVLTIINSIFGDSSSDLAVPHKLSPKLVRSAFDSLQLVCSDFLSNVPSSNLLTLLSTLHSFCSQDQDLNISLTSATFFRNVSDYLQRDGGRITLQSFGSNEPNDTNLSSWADDGDTTESNAALWVYLLLRLVVLSTDARLEVRHNSLHTLFRIFDACLDQLTVSAMNVCFSTILAKLLEANEDQFQKAKALPQSEKDESLTKSWNKTAIIEVNGIAGLFSQWLESYKEDPTFATMSQEICGHFTSMLNRHTLSASNAVFTGFSNILAVMESTKSTEVRELPVLDKGWKMWENGNPASHTEDTDRERNENQDALASYLDCLQNLLRLTGETLRVEQVDYITEQLRVCVVMSNASAYSTDIDRMTPIQDSVLKSLALITTTNVMVIPKLAKSVCGFLTLSYEQQNNVAGKKQTYVALSKAAMTLLEFFVIEHLKRPQLDAVSLVIRTCEALAIPIHLKYSWAPEGKAPSPWRKATTTALAILETATPFIQASKYDAPQFWEVVIKISDGIVAANCNACTNRREIPDDQDFDVEAFSRIRKLIVPALGSSSVPDIVRRKYAESICKNSIIHEPHIDDLARPGQELLEGLQSQHIGRVNDLPPSPRSNLSYKLLDELFDLVAVHDGSSERIKLAQAAAPYLILRTGLTLKAYIMDHPLRGRMPQPWSQKKEMYYVLRKLTDLDSEPKAIPAAPRISSENKKHLHRLYPLVIKALKAAWRDEEMTIALQEMLEAVGDDFGI